MAAQDSNFKERYENKAKSMGKCISYITQQARRQAVNNCAAISDSDVLQMAVHYYQEEDVEPTASTPKVIKPKPVLVPKPVKAKKGKKKKEDNSHQLNLFDF